MWIRRTLPCLALLLLPGITRASEPLKIACVELTLESGVEESTRDLLYERLLAQVEAAGSHDVLGKTDIDTMLGLEEERQKLGCLDKASCIAEIGGALGVQQIISGNIGRIGESLLINLKRIDVRRARAVSRVSRRFRGGSAEQLLDALPSIVAELFDESKSIADPPPEPKPAVKTKPKPAAKPKPVARRGSVPPPEREGPTEEREPLWASQSFWGWIAIGVGGATLAAGAGAGGFALSQQNELENKRYDANKYDDTVESIDRSALAADVLIGVGLAAAAAGVILLLLDRGPDEASASTTEPPIEVLVGPTVLGLRGHF